MEWSKAGQQFRRVLQVGIHDAENGGVGVLPAVEDGSRQAPLPMADEQPHALVLQMNCGDNILGAVAAVVVHDQNLVGDC